MHSPYMNINTSVLQSVFSRQK